MLIMPCLVTPRARIRFWRGLAGDSVQLGEDVFLECEVAANPAVYNVTWRHNVGTTPRAPNKPSRRTLRNLREGSLEPTVMPIHTINADCRASGCLRM